jgi:3-oxoacyl-[acyl-carrier protein] reductase
MRLGGRTVLVTGASRGIGAATARLGARVAVNYPQRGEAARAVVATIAVGGGKALAVRADVRDPAQVEPKLV